MSCGIIFFRRCGCHRRSYGCCLSCGCLNCLSCDHLSCCCVRCLSLTSLLTTNCFCCSCCSTSCCAKRMSCFCCSCRSKSCLCYCYPRPMMTDGLRMNLAGGHIPSWSVMDGCCWVRCRSGVFRLCFPCGLNLNRCCSDDLSRRLFLCGRWCQPWDVR